MNIKILVTLFLSIFFLTACKIEPNKNWSDEKKIEYCAEKLEGKSVQWFLDKNKIENYQWYTEYFDENKSTVEQYIEQYYEIIKLYKSNQFPCYLFAKYSISEKFGLVQNEDLIIPKLNKKRKEKIIFHLQKVSKGMPKIEEDFKKFKEKNEKKSK